MHVVRLNRTSGTRVHKAPRPSAMLVLAAALLCLASSASAVAAGAIIDWTKAPETKVTLFYPGQSSWEWVMTESDHSGAPKFRGGKNCKSCHDGEQTKIGEDLAKKENSTPMLPHVNRPSLVLHVATAHDDQRLYFRLRWTAGAANGGRLDPDFAERVAVMIDDGHVKAAARAGCWASCHDDAIGMASAPKDGEITKYLTNSRTKITRSGGGKNFKPATDLDQLLKSGDFLEYWQARLNPGKPAQAIGGYILDKRHELSNSGVAADATLQNGEWTVVLSGPLKAQLPGEKNFVPDTTYTIGFAVHDGYTDHRFHLISFEQTLMLDHGTADFIASKQ
ncbi:MAG: ethylbenzene dehydrogenase-related protein [Rhodanobacter sp.]